MLGALSQTFQTLPIGGGALRAAGIQQLAAYGGVLCLHGVTMALPMTFTMITINVSLGMLSRAAPQLNIFSIGFPVTLGCGMVMLSLGLPEWVRSFDVLWETSLDAVTRCASVL
jgi:flagellar biosynthetic protein FliR